MGSFGDELSLGSMPRSDSKGCKLVKRLEEEKKKIESCEIELPLCLEILNNAILYLKRGNERFDIKHLISLNKPFQEDDMQLELMKEKKFLQWKPNDQISNSKLEIERSMLLSPKVETGLGLGLISSPPCLQQQALRKQRRCWTPELHRRFVDALYQLGGPGVATPKQIREHMQEEGLTNDEVKSHLQKYRLHIRKPNSNPEKQSVVLLGFNLWNSGETGGKEEEEESSSKRSNSQSDSPQGPLHLPCTTGGDSSMEDAKSESF